MKFDFMPSSVFNPVSGKRFLLRSFAGCKSRRAGRIILRQMGAGSVR